VLGDAVGLSLCSCSYRSPRSGSSSAASPVILAVPLVAVLATLLDVIVRNRDPSAEDVPSVLSRRQGVGPSEKSQFSAGRYALRQRPKTRPPSVKPNPNVPTAKPPIATAFRHGDSRLPAPQRLPFLGRRARPRAACGSPHPHVVRGRDRRRSRRTHRPSKLSL
jgi:hypothetical protein